MQQGSQVQSHLPCTTCVLAWWWNWTDVLTLGWRWKSTSDSDAHVWRTHMMYVTFRVLVCQWNWTVSNLVFYAQTTTMVISGQWNWTDCLIPWMVKSTLGFVYVHDPWAAGNPRRWYLPARWWWSLWYSTIFWLWYSTIFWLWYSTIFWLWYSTIFCSWADTALLLHVILNEWLGLFIAHFSTHQSGLLTALFGYYMAGAMWNCCHLGVFCVHFTTMHHVTSFQAMPYT